MLAESSRVPSHQLAGNLYANGMDRDSGVHEQEWQEFEKTSVARSTGERKDRLVCGGKKKRDD